MLPQLCTIRWSTKRKKNGKIEEAMVLENLRRTVAAFWQALQRTSDRREEEVISNNFPSKWKVNTSLRLSPHRMFTLKFEQQFCPFPNPIKTSLAFYRHAWVSCQSCHYCGQLLSKDSGQMSKSWCKFFDKKKQKVLQTLHRHTKQGFPAKIGRSMTSFSTVHDARRPRCKHIHS